MATTFPANAPINFVNTNGGTDTLNFNADGPATNLKNKAQNFVVTTPGDLLYRAAGGNNYLERLPIGSVGQFLSVSGAGLPAWSGNLPSGQGIFSAFVTGTANPIPSSTDTGANPGFWFPLSGNNPYVVWTSSVNPDGAFSTTVGPTYGTYTVPVTGTYLFSALVTFDLGAGVNAGMGISSSPSGTSVRQVDLFDNTTATILSTNSVQTSPSNNNTTSVALTSVAAQLTAGDVITLRVRHDRAPLNTVTIGTTATPTSTYFSGGRIR